MNDVEQTKAIEEVAEAEKKCREVDKEYSKAYSKINRIRTKFPVPENKLLKEMCNRLEELKSQRRKLLKDIKNERLNEYRRKVNFRKEIPELKIAKEELKLISEKRNKLYKDLNLLEEKYGTKIYNAGWDLYKKLKNEKLKEVKE